MLISIKARAHSAQVMSLFQVQKVLTEKSINRKKR